MQFIKILVIFSFITLFHSYYLFGQFNVNGTLTFDGDERNYILHMPTETIEEAEGLPLVFNLHGLGSNAVQQEFYSGMNTTSNEENFIVCYPEGIDNSWNVGFPGGSNADDVGFISALIDELEFLYGIDKNRVYSCGMSNGGFMSYELACKIPDQIAAIASVTGSMTTIIDCDLNTMGTPILEIHGTADEVVPYNGSNGISPIDDVISFWTQKNGCFPNEVTVIEINDSNQTDGSTAEHTIYYACNENKNVELFKITGGAHTWPGASVAIGVTNYDINANQEIWKFFNRFSLDGSVTSVNELQDNTLNISPNPAGQTIDVNLPESEIYTITLHDIDGNQVAKSRDNNTIDVSLIPSGLYVICIISNAIVITEKVVIQH